MNYSMLIKLTSPSSIVHVLAHARLVSRYVPGSASIIDHICQHLSSVIDQASTWNSKSAEGIEAGRFQAWFEVRTTLEF